MSFLSWLYWSCLLGGWSAFLGWLVTEIVLGRWVAGSVLAAIVMACLVAAAIGGGLTFAAGLTNLPWRTVALRCLPGLVGGFLAGLLGSGIGSGIYALVGGRYAILDVLGRVLGWTCMGLCLGAVPGLLERQHRKILTGALGGLAGGFLGGLLFNPLSWLVGSPVSSRAFGFVLLGLAIGLFTGLVQLAFRQAWLTVEAGFRPGRQLLLDAEQVTLGTSEKANLIFIAVGAKGVEPLHLRLLRQPDGTYHLQDNASRTGTRLNGRPVARPAPIRDGDLIEFGPNAVRFRERLRRDTAAALPLEPSDRRPTPPSKPSARVPPPPLPTAVLAPPSPAPAAPPAVTAAPCPVCGTMNKGMAGQRRCRDCFTVY